MTVKRKSVGSTNKKKSVKNKTTKSLKKVTNVIEQKSVKAEGVIMTRECIDEPTFSIKPHDGEKSGKFIERMLETNALTTAEIIQAVRNNYPGSKASAASVAFIRLHLKKAGTETKVVRIDKKGVRYTLAA